MCHASVRPEQLRATELEIASLPANSDHSHLPPISGRRVPMPIEFACILSVHERGFAFARLLTGDEATGAGQIFLNEARVAALRSELPSLVGAVVAVQPVAKSDGRLSALQGWPIALHDSYTASKLWESVAEHRKVESKVLAPAFALMPEAPAHLPLTLALLDAKCSDRLAQTLVGCLPEQAWTACDSDLELPLEHAGPGVKKKVISYLIANRAVRAYDLLQSSRIRAGITLSASEIEVLWGVDEALSRRVGDWLVSWSQQAPSDAMLSWASQHFEGSSSRQNTAWRVIANVMARPNADWPIGWDSWVALAVAPPAIAWQLGRQRHANWLAAMTTLHEVVLRSVKKLAFCTDDLLASLDADDEFLAGQWSTGSKSDNPAIVNRLRAQMLTARAAEKCALRYLEGFGQTVRDIAITQLQDGATDWRIGGLWIFN